MTPAPASSPKSERTFAVVLTFLFLLAAANPAAAVKRRAFATSVSGTGLLGDWPDAGATSGLTAGNAICQARASAAGLSNPTHFRAWLSNGWTDAYCNVQGLFGTRADDCEGQSLPVQGPWFLPNGSIQFAGTLEELTAERAEIYRPILADEFGDFLTSGSSIWTGTSALGERTGNDCTNWFSEAPDVLGSAGMSNATAGSWTRIGGENCDGTARLLCFEALSGETATLHGSPGSLVFVTSAEGTGDLEAWPEANEATGIQAGDEICRALAADAGLPSPDSFLAWLSNEWTNAGDRVSSDGPFRRVDGFVIANDRDDLLDGAIANSVHVDERGRYATSDYEVFTATASNGDTNTTCCSNWSSNLGTVTAGRAAFARSHHWTAAFALFCATDAHLYCFSNTVVLFWDGFEITGDTSRWSAVSP